MAHSPLNRALALVGFTVIVSGACWEEPRAGAEPRVPVPPEADVEPAFASLGAATQSLASPVRVALTPAGRLLVSDYARGAVFQVDPETLLPTGALTCEGRPLAVGVWGSRVFVGNATTKTVEVYGANGTHRYDFSPGWGAVEDPKDLAIDKRLGLIFVLDGAARLVRVFNPSGMPLFTVGGPGTGEARFQNPTAVALDPDRGEVLVSDYGDGMISEPPRIKIFDYDGNFLTAISGKSGLLGRRFSRPQGLEVDGTGNIFLVDAFSGEVLVINRDTGQSIATIGTYGEAPGELRLPWDLAIDRSGTIYVTNGGNGRIERYQEGAVLP